MSEPMTTAAPETVLGCDGLGMVYAEGKMRTPVFDGLHLAVGKGETVAILGASGAGKSTLLHLLGGLDTPTTGEVFVAGQKMSALSDTARGVLRNRALGFVYQFHHLLPEFTAVENVMLPVLLNNTGVPEATRRAKALLEAVGLGHRTHPRGARSHQQPVGVVGAGAEREPAPGARRAARARRQGGTARPGLARSAPAPPTASPHRRSPDGRGTGHCGAPA